MGQANSAQREPSMEEILASIRRIIEDNESNQDRSEADENYPTSHEDIEASDAAESHAQAPAAHVDDKAFGAAWQSQEVDDAQEHSGDSEPGDTGQRHQIGPQGMNENTGAEAACQPEMEPMAAEVTPDTGSRAPQEMSDALNRFSGTRPGILSEASGRAVSAAFDELSQAFETNRRQSLAEAAEEMLRPLLQEWLDNNLPKLVERLVREEIERVARGGSR